MKKNPPGYMTTPGERQSYWTYFVGQNSYYYITTSKTRATFVREMPCMAR